MGSEEFSRTVGGSGGASFATSANGSLESNNYLEGAGFDHDGTAYPYTLDPAFDVQELVIMDAGDIVAHITTANGTTFDLPLAGAVAALDHWEIDSVEFRDPNGTGARIAGGVAGE